MMDMPISQVKRPKASYLCFHVEESHKMKIQNPDIGQNEFAKKIGAMWQAMSEDQKEIWKKKSADDKARYEKEVT